MVGGKDEIVVKIDKNSPKDEEMPREEIAEEDDWKPGAFKPVPNNEEWEDCLITEVKDGVTLVKGLNIARVLKTVLRKLSFLYIMETRLTYVYVPKNGGYSPGGDELILRELLRLFRPYYDLKGKPIMNQKRANEILFQIQKETVHNVVVFEQKDPIFNVSNGVLDLVTCERLPHDPKYRMREQSPVIYDLTADCPKFKSYIADRVDQKYHAVLQEMFGYAMWHKYDAQRAFMLYGPPRTGKGTLLRVLQEMLGKDSYSSVNLQDLINHTFKRAELFGKRANISGDVPATPIKDPQMFQNLTGGDDVTVEFKYGRPFQMSNAAKLIFGANKLPRAINDDDAFYARWVIIPVEHTFIENEDPSIEAALKSPEELSGILNWALEGLARLRANGWKFSEHINGLSMYKKLSKPEIAFLEEMYEPSTDDYVTKADLAVAYNKWATSKGLPPATSMKAFCIVIGDQMTIPVNGDYRPSINGAQQEAWKGIKRKI